MCSFSFTSGTKLALTGWIFRKGSASKCKIDSCVLFIFLASVTYVLNILIEIHYCSQVFAFKNYIYKTH